MRTRNTSCSSSNSPSSRLKRDARRPSARACASNRWPTSDSFSSLTPLVGLAGQRVRGRRPDPPVRQPRRPAGRPRAPPAPPRRPAGAASWPARPRRRIARPRAGAVQLVDRRRQRQLAAHLGARERLDGQRRREAKDRVAAVEREEVDQVEVQLPPQLEVDPPADVPPAQERVQDVELALLQLGDLVGARRPPQHVAAEVGVEAQRRLERTAGCDSPSSPRRRAGAMSITFRSRYCVSRRRDSSSLLPSAPKRRTW